MSLKSSIPQTKEPESSEKSERVSNADLLAWMKNIHQELKTIRQLASERTRFMRDAEAEIPEGYRRFLNGFHDMHDIKFMNEEHGADVPLEVLRALERFYDRFRQIERAQTAEGGAMNKILKEMAPDPENRYDHTRLLAKPQEKPNESKEEPDAA